MGADELIPILVIIILTLIVIALARETLGNIRMNQQERSSAQETEKNKP